MPKLLSDNGSSYVALDFKKYLKNQEIKPVHGRPGHPQTQGKIERYHRSTKNVFKLDVYYSPMELEKALKHFVDYYNHECFHKSLRNVTPADMYFGRTTRILEHRKKIKQKTMMERRRKYYAATYESKIYSDAFLGHQKPRKMHVGNKFYAAITKISKN